MFIRLRTLCISIIILSISISHTMEIQDNGLTHQWSSKHIDENDPLFDTKFLLQYDQVSQHLQNHYLADVITFKTEDDINLKGFWIPRVKPNNGLTTSPTAPIVVAPGGFYPGNKEGMSTILKQLPDDCSYLIYDGRGHNQSEGTFWSTLRQYGMHEYKDVIAAMNYAKGRGGNRPLILLGMCAGGFHAINALDILKWSNKLEAYNVRGVILDSAFSSCTSVLPAGEYHFREKLIPQQLRSYVYTSARSSEEVKDRYMYSVVWHCLGRPFVALLTWWVKKDMERNDPTTNIMDKMKYLRNIPMMFIHANDDPYVPTADVVQLKEYHGNENDTIHLLNKSSHTLSCLKKKYTYRYLMHTFIKKALETSENASA